MNLGPFISTPTLLALRADFLASGHKLPIPEREAMYRLLTKLLEARLDKTDGYEEPLAQQWVG